jgi:hypothetical protein
VKGKTMQSIKFYLSSAFMLLVFFQLEAAPSFQLNSPPTEEQLTFSYTSEEIEAIKRLPRSETRITKEELDTLTNKISFVLKSTELSGIDETILPPYLANVQKDFAFLSYLITGDLAGSLCPITAWTLQLFIPEISIPLISEEEYDVYSGSLAALVIKKAAERLSEERKQIANYPIKKGDEYWRPANSHYRGLNFGSAKTWYLASSDEFVADTPPKNMREWKAECDKIKKENTQLDEEKTQKVFEWAGLTGLDAGSWERILQDYMDQNNVSIAAQLSIRALFLSALADSNAVSFHSKYTFWVKRPSQLDEEIEPMIRVPSHPSYPSAHSTISGTAVVVLTEIFPENAGQWNQLAEEAGMSRIWGGIHYPIDHRAGMKLGKAVGRKIVQTQLHTVNNNRQPLNRKPSYK